MVSLLLSVANSSPPAVQRHQAIAVAESLAGVSTVFPGASRRREPCLVRPLASPQSGETVSKERLRFDTRQTEGQPKIALGNLNGLNVGVKFDLPSRLQSPPEVPPVLRIPRGYSGLGPAMS